MSKEIPSPTDTTNEAAEYAYKLERVGDTFLTISQRLWIDIRRKHTQVVVMEEENGNSNQDK